MRKRLKDLYVEYVTACTRRRIVPMSQRALNTELVRQGAVKAKRNGQWMLIGEWTLPLSGASAIPFGPGDVQATFYLPQPKEAFGL